LEFLWTFQAEKSGVKFHTFPMTLENYAGLLLKTDCEQEAQELLSRIHTAQANDANGLP